jgi:hypothetical protein
LAEHTYVAVEQTARQAETELIDEILETVFDLWVPWRVDGGLHELPDVDRGLGSLSLDFDAQRILLLGTFKTRNRCTMVSNPPFACVWLDMALERERTATDSRRR